MDDNNIVKITDFGTCRQLSSNYDQDDNTSISVGTPAYIAPEIIHG